MCAVFEWDGVHLDGNVEHLPGNGFFEILADQFASSVCLVRVDDER